MNGPTLEKRPRDVATPLKSTWLGLIFATPFRLFAIYTSLFCFAVAVTFIAVYAVMEARLVRDARIAAAGDAQLLRLGYERGGLLALKEEIDDRGSTSQTALYLLTDAQGNRIAGNLGVVTAGLWNVVGPVDFTYRRDGIRGPEEHFALGLVTRIDGSLRLVAARDTRSLEKVKRALRAAFAAGFSFIVFFGLTGGILVSRRILRRIDDASAAAQAIMNGKLTERVPLTGRGDEFDRLSRNLNAMLDRIQDLMAGLKDVSDNIAHDLKTPLHRLRTRAERALHVGGPPEKLAEALGSVIEDADGLIQTFDSLLNIARLEAGARDDTFGILDVCALVRDVVDLYEPLAEENGLCIRLACTGSVEVAGERHLLAQAVANLIDNAIKYAGRNGTSRTDPAIDVSLIEKSDTVSICVADRGPGISPEDRVRAIQRFVRLHPSRSIPGSGLGLSLVSAVARLHGGTIRLTDNGPGLKVEFTIMKNRPAGAAGPPA